jgi:hypothetical protein
MRAFEHLDLRVVMGGSEVRRALSSSCLADCGRRRL